MDASTMPTTGYELRFRSLFDAGRGYAFPCDVHGRIALEGMSQRARASLGRVRGLVGVELAAPEVVRRSAEPADG